MCALQALNILLETDINSFHLYNVNLECASKLLEIGSRVDGVDEDGRSLIHVAAEQNAHEFARNLLANTHKSPSSFAFSVFMVDMEGNTPLHSAAYTGSLEVGRLLLNFADNNGKDLLERRNNLGRTALHLASFYAHPVFSEFLISKVACSNERKETKLTK